MWIDVRKDTRLVAAILVAVSLLGSGCGARDSAAEPDVPATAVACIEQFNRDRTTASTFVGDTWDAFVADVLMGDGEVAAVIAHGDGACRIGFLDQGVDLLLRVGLRGSGTEPYETAELDRNMTLSEFDEVAEDSDLRVYLAYIGEQGITTDEPDAEASTSSSDSSEGVGSQDDVGGVDLESCRLRHDYAKIRELESDDCDDASQLALLAADHLDRVGGWQTPQEFRLDSGERCWLATPPTKGLPQVDCEGDGITIRFIGGDPDVLL